MVAIAIVAQSFVAGGFVCLFVFLIFLQLLPQTAVDTMLGAPGILLDYTQSVLGKESGGKDLSEIYSLLVLLALPRSKETDGRKGYAVPTVT